MPRPGLRQVRGRSARGRALQGRRGEPRAVAARRAHDIKSTAWAQPCRLAGVPGAAPPLPSAPVLRARPKHSPGGRRGGPGNAHRSLPTPAVPILRAPERQRSADPHGTRPRRPPGPATSRATRPDPPPAPGRPTPVPPTRGPPPRQPITLHHTTVPLHHHRRTVPRPALRAHVPPGASPPSLQSCPDLSIFVKDRPLPP